MIGLGNPLHGDDGFAAEVCRCLAADALPQGVRVIDAGLRGLDALAQVRPEAALILLDAAAPAGRPGRVNVHAAHDLLASLPEGGPHGAGLAYLVHAAHALGVLPDQAWVCTAEAEALPPFHAGLSAPVAAAVAPVVAWVRAQVVA